MGVGGLTHALSDQCCPRVLYICVGVQAEFIATNLDAVTHLTDAQEWAGNGSMVGAIKGKPLTPFHIQGVIHSGYMYTYRV